MANQFQIVITAKDQASAAVGKVTSALGRVRGPIAGISSAVERLGETTGLASLGRGLSSLGGLARDTAGNLGVLGGSMGAVAGAGTVAGVATLVNHWGQVGVATANAAGGIGIAAGRLRTLQGAAGLAGLSAESMAGSLGALAATLQDAAFGRNPEAAAMMNTLGMRLHRTASGAVDAERAMGDLAEAVSRQTNPQTQARIAQIFGVEALLPMLRKGRSGWQAYMRDIERYGAVSEETQKQSEQLGASINRLKAAVSGAGTTLEAEYSGKFGGAIDRTAKWISENQRLSGSIAEVGLGLGAIALAARAHPVLGLITGIAEGALLIYRHWDGIGAFFERKLKEVDAAFNSSEWGRRTSGKTPKAERDAYWWTFGLVGKGGMLYDTGPGEPAAPPKPDSATPAPAAPPKPDSAAPAPATPPETRPSIINGFLIGRAEAAPMPPSALVPPAAPPLVPDRPAAAEARPLAAPAPAAVAPPPPAAPAAAPAAAHQPIGIRNNNPLNLRSWGATPREGGFAKFGSADEGLAAAVKNLGAYQDRHGINTIAGIINRWAPPSDGNNVPAYISHVAKETGYRPDQPLDLHDPKTVAPLLSAMIKRENGMQPYGRDQIERAAATAAPPNGGAQQPIQVDIRFSGNVPPGTTASVPGQDGAFQPSRIDYSLPDFARP